MAIRRVARLEDAAALKTALATSRRIEALFML
jgi:hypothetical protein